MRSRSITNLRNSVEVVYGELYHLRRAVEQRDHMLATIITNLQTGAAPQVVLEWWEETKPRLIDIGDGDG